MSYHFIAIASDYYRGRRIGWHYASEGKIDKEIIKDFLEDSKRVLGVVDLGIHKLTTDSISWQSVIEKDSFFEDVFIIEDSDAFLETLSADKEITANDIAKFLLSLFPMSNLKLQKLIYFAYATYLKKTEKKLFNDSIVAYRYGPVVEDVYLKYRKNGRSIIDYKDDTKFYLSDISFPMASLKILLNPEGRNIINSLLETIDVYGSKTPLELVDISHCEGSPWSQVYEDDMNSEITDKIISKYHYVERKLLD